MAPALANSLDLPHSRNVITLQQAARSSSNASYIGISCRCKGMCTTNRCGCKKNGVECSVYCHRGARDCGRWIQGPEFKNYALVEGEGGDGGNGGDNQASEDTQE